MNCNRVNWGAGLIALVVLTFGLAGCGSEPAPVVQPPAPPPAPPPFQPQPVEIALGEHGGTVTLMTAEGGGYTLNGEAFAGGEVEAENGNKYLLALEDDKWTAVFQAPEGIEVMLGDHGGTVMITKAEDGTYWIGEMGIESGGSVTAENGNMYTLTMDDEGMWSAMYVPMEGMVTVASLGLEIAAMRAEDGTWTAVHPLTQETITLTEGGMIMAGDNTYMLSSDGMGNWMAAFVMPDPVSVMLGMHGGTRMLQRAEDGSWWYGEDAFMSGDMLMGDNGQYYTLTMGDDGMWMAMWNKPDPVMVTLDTSGTVMLQMAEDNSWWIGDMAFSSGDTYTASNGNMYMLTYHMEDGDAHWDAMFQPASMEIMGTGLTAMSREDQMGYDVMGSETGLDASGMGDVTVDGEMFHVWMDDGMLMGAQFDDAIHGDTDIPEVALVGDLRQAADPDNVGQMLGENMLPTLSADDEDTAANELRTKLSIGGQTFSIADLLGAGSASAMGDNYVAKALENVEKALGDATALLNLAEEPTGLSGLLDQQWTRVQTAVDTVFGTGTVDLGTRPREDDLLNEIEDIVQALSSADAFAAATMEDGKGVFEDAKLSEADAMKAFDAAMSEANIAFGMTGATRYGAISVMTRGKATDDADYAWGRGLGNGDGNDDNPEMGLVGAFSYGTIDETQRVHDIQTSGTAYYEGGTVAVSGAGTLYTGDIALEIRFSSNRVSGLVTNLRTADGDAWTYQYGAVESIILATSNDLNNTTAQWGTPSDAQARVTFEPRAGATLPQPLPGSFQGQLLGRGDDSGNHAHGTWSVGTQTSAGSSAYLAGSFGAERVTDEAPTRPGTDDGSVHETVVTSNDGVEEAALTNMFKIDDGNLVVTMTRASRIMEIVAAGADPTTEVPDPDDLRGDDTTTIVRLVLGAVTTAPTANPDSVVLEAADGLLIFDKDATETGVQADTIDLSQSLADVLANAETDRNVNGPDKQIQIAVKAIEAAQSDLSVLQGLDQRNDASEIAAWKRVQSALLRLFHHVPPKVAEDYDEDRALGLIGQVLDALSSEANLASALDRDGRGIFNDVTKDDGVTAPSASLIWGRQEVQLKTHGGGTDYTRWGVWRVRTDRYAARDAWTNFLDDDTNDNAPGAYAYSQLLTTTWSDGNDPGFPGGGTATFMGGTTAIAGTAFYDGDLRVQVQWYSTTGDDAATTWDGTDGDPLGTLSMSIMNMTNADGDALTETGGAEIYSIRIGAVDIVTNTDNQVVFNTGATTQVSTATFQGLTGAFGGGTPTTLGGSSIMGRFVGQDVEGPLGVMGTYVIGAAGIGPANPLIGAFGADRP